MSWLDNHEARKKGGNLKNVHFEKKFPEIKKQITFFPYNYLK